MPVEHLTSLEIQLDDELANPNLSLSEKDRALCRALFKAIRSVQLQSMPADWKIPPLPQSVRTTVLRWHAATELKWRTDPESIESAVQRAERLGLKRTRGNSDGTMTAYEHAGQSLGISANTVANKAGRVRLLGTKRKK
jgi:hypothetical protein